MGLHSSCSGGPLLICGGSAPLYLSLADSSLVVSVGEGELLFSCGSGLLSSSGRVLSSNCDRGGYCLVVM